MTATGQHAGTAAQRRSSIRPADGFRLAFTGIRARRLRSVLSALGIAIGIAAMLAVVGISSSSQARVTQQLSSLGTNLLRAEAGKSLFGDETSLPPDTVGKIRLMNGVESAGSIGVLTSVHVYRSPLADPNATGGIQVAAADPGLLTVTGTTLHSGVWLNKATSKYPAVVLGSAAAQRLGVVEPGGLVWLGDQYFSVLGVLDPSPLAPELDASALTGEQAAHTLLDWNRSPTTVYERSTERSLEHVRKLLPRTVNPQAPDEVSVSRPSDALAAKAAIDQAFTRLLVGIGAIALLVGGIGVANTMIISVIERRREVGVRRALGATRAHIRTQFLTEALVLSGLGGCLGALIGCVTTAVIAWLNAWPVAIPLEPVAIGLIATLVIGAAAGLYPAMRAAGIPPTSALNG
ncbi:ABC transporter permease [Streptomyces sp. NRRL F-5126]|uniref:ABC transporter permease n=1 Tax=Streptomyces sp. NRRL F-5126 TaxID=1463857 RepID=UPI0004C79BE8|nr:ABC transporter permease [Streptomyces sp. NRRL F-5126]